MINDALQGKFLAAANDLGRFLLNSTVGIGGILDPATLGRIGQATTRISARPWATGACTPGPFVELPLLGPSDLRDAPAQVVDSYTNPRAVHQATTTWKYGLVPAVSGRQARGAAAAGRHACSTSTTRTPSFATPICSAAPTWSPTARSAMSSWSIRAADSPDIGQARARQARARDSRRRPHGTDAHDSAAALARDQQFLDLAQARELLQLRGNIVRSAGFGLRPSRRSAIRSAARVPSCRSPVTPARSMTAAQPRVDGLAPSGEQRRHGGEMQRSDDARALALQDLEGGDLLARCRYTCVCLLNGCCARGCGCLLLVSSRLMTSSRPFCWISEPKSVRKLLT